MPKFYSLEEPPSEKIEELTKELHEYPELKPRLAFAFPLNENRRQALEMIKSGKIELEQVIKLLESNDFVEKKIGAYLLKEVYVSKISEKDWLKVLPILEELIKDDEKWHLQQPTIPALKILALQRLRGIKKGRIEKGHKWLLATQKPLFATFETKALSEKILKIQKIVKKLEQEFKDDFIGLTIFGSTAKGYSQKESDLDWGIIAKNKRVSERFKELASSLHLCFEHYAGLNERYQIQENEDVLFYGLFFGNYEKLLTIQKNFLESSNPEKWDGVRRKIFENETNLVKAQERFGIEEQELEKINQVVALLRVPPSYEETLKIIRERIEAMRHRSQK